MEFWTKKDFWELSKEGELQHSIEDEEKEFENLLKLTYCNTPELLFHLKKRFYLNNIYTYAGQILIALNPFKKLDIYNREFVDINKCHLYNIIEKENTSFLISGESGAGKTETTKKILEYLSYNNDTVRVIEHFNYFLEAFGNAETQFNKNSSRFGKYIEIKIGKKVSAEVKTYLLETSRINDKHLINFHIFNFLNVSNKIPTYFNGDNRGWEYDYLEINNLRKIWCLYFDVDLFDKIVNIVKGIYYLNKGEYENCSVVWNVRETDIINVLNYHTLNVGGEKVVKKNQCTKTVAKSISCLIYNKVFNLICDKFNNLIKGDSGDDGNYITYGILDIFGFENFIENHFEQFCINYTNERLQNIFNKHIFKEEIKLFEDEGILNEKITFENNDLLLENINNNVIKNIDDVTMVQGGVNDFINKLKDKNEKIKVKNDNFIIEHYACEVEYNCDEFIDKNVEKYSLDITEFITKLNFFEEVGKKKIKNRRGSIGRDTVLHKFKNDLSSLVNKIEGNNIKFIRCIKPNDNGLCGEWDENKIETQMNYCGIIEAINLSRKVYPVRIPKGLFAKNYGCLEGSIDGIVYGKNYNFMNFDVKSKLDKKLLEYKLEKGKVIYYFLLMIRIRNEYRNDLKRFKFVKDILKKWVFKIRCNREIQKKKCGRLIIGMWWGREVRRRLFAKKLICNNVLRHYCRNKLERLKKESKAVCIVQKIWRGHSTRLLLKMGSVIDDFEKYEEIVIIIKRYFDRRKFGNYMKLKNSMKDEIMKTEMTIYDDIILKQKEKILEYEKIINEFYNEQKVNMENDYYLLQREFFAYKKSMREAQEKIGEKMLNLYKENINLREENVKLLNELNSGNNWFKKIFS